MTPNTTVELYATPLDISNKFVIYAESRDAAYSICQNWPKQVFTNCYWERENFVFRCNGNINDLEQYNYCVFINDGHYNFAFITGYQYINDGMTQISLQIDPWFNYAGMYDFAGSSSSFKRCHPSSTSVLRVMRTPEPVDFQQWVTIRSGEVDTSALSDHFYLVSSVDYDTFDNQAVNVFDAIGQLLLGNGSAIGSTFAAMQSTVCDCGTIIQMPTARLTGQRLTDVIRAFTAAGQQNMLIAIYMIPSYYDDVATEGLCTYLPVTVASGSNVLAVDAAYKTEVRSPKMWQSDQFLRIVINFHGNTRVYKPSEFDLTSAQDGNYTFHIKAVKNLNGCPVFYFDNFLAGSSASAIFGPHWTRVAYSTVAVTPGALGYNVIDTMSALKTGIDSMVTGPLSMVSGIAKSADFAFSNIRERSLGESAVIGSNGGGDYEVLATFPTSIELTIQAPAPVERYRIADFLGTYGYNMDGETDTMGFTTRQSLYSKFVYMETMNCSLSAPQVPQNALADVIRQFNSGTFIFWNASDFKNFDNPRMNLPA